MTSFKQEITKRIRFQVIKAITVAAFVIIVFILKVRSQGSIEAMSNIDKCLLLGMFLGGEISALRALFNYRQAMGTPEALEALHIMETDERNRAIILKTCRSTLSLTCTLLSFAGIVASFYSLTVLWTIAVILVAILGIYGSLKLYYLQKI